MTLATCASSDRALASASSESSPLRHVLNRADIFQLPIIVSDPVRDQVQVLDRTVRHQQPVLVLKVADRASRPSIMSFISGMSSGWTRPPISSSVTGTSRSNPKMR